MMKKADHERMAALSTEARDLRGLADNQSLQIEALTQRCKELERAAMETEVHKQAYEWAMSLLNYERANRR